MKIKFTRTLILAIACLLVFLTTSFVYHIGNAKLNDFLRGFSAGMGAVAFIAAVYYYFEMQKAKKVSNVR